MVKAKRIVIDTKTGEESQEEFEFTPPEPSPELKGIDLQKLKAVLLAKGIIEDPREIE